MTPDEQQALDYYKRGMEQETKRANIWFNSYKLWRDFASRANLAESFQDIRVDYQRTMAADVPIDTLTETK